MMAMLIRRALRVVMVVGAVCGAIPAVAGATTTVSLAFDDGAVNQLAAQPLLAARNLQATFFVSSGRVGSNSYYMSWSALRGLAADGNEIAAHGKSGNDLTAMTSDAARREICDDRTALAAQGFSVSGFAYPYGRYNADVVASVQACGYAVARRYGGLQDPVECTSCAPAETLPPKNTYAVRTNEWLSHAYTLADLEGWVTRAEAAGGGWVPIVLNDICDACGSASVSRATLESFLDWLAARASQGTVVRTFAQVMAPSPPSGDTTPPQTTVSCNGAACSDTPYVQSVRVTLTAQDAGSGVRDTYYTTDGSEPTTTSTRYTGPFDLTATTTLRFRSWDVAGNAEPVQSQLIRVTTGTTSAPTTVSLTFDDGAASQYVARSLLASHGLHGTFFINSGLVGANSYYMTWAQVDALAASGNEIGGHTLDHPRLTSLSTADARREICADRDALRARGYSVSSFAYPHGAYNSTVTGLVSECGYTAARNYGGLYDPEDCTSCPYANTVPPADALHIRTPPWLPRSFTLADLKRWVTQAEDHGGGWVPLVFHDICTGCGDTTVTAADLDAFLAWLQDRVATGALAVKTVAEVVPPAVTPTDVTPPHTTIACAGGPCTPWFRSPVAVTLSATDSGSGVASTHYTLDGTTPTLQSPAYTGPISLTATRTVRFRSWDKQGNAEPEQAQTVKVDGTAPVSQIACNGAACSTSQYPGPVTITLSASDAGSGVAAIRYTTNGTTPTTSSPLYTGAFQISATRTIKFRAWDVVGNVEAVKSRKISVG